MGLFQPVTTGMSIALSFVEPECSVIGIYFD